MARLWTTVIIIALTLVGFEASAQELPNPVRLSLSKEFSTASLAYLGPVYNDRASGKVEEYAHANGTDLVGGKKIYSDFKQAYFDSLGAHAGKENLLLAIVGDGKFGFPAHSTIYVERYDGTSWLATSVFRIRYRAQKSGYYRPEVVEVGLHEAATIDESPPMDFDTAIKNPSQYEERYFSACDGIIPNCSAITFFVCIPKISVDGQHQWPRADRSPFMISFTPKGGAL